VNFILVPGTNTIHDENERAEVSADTEFLHIVTFLRMGHARALLMNRRSRMLVLRLWK
jgi:hypothetical protein